MRVIRLSMRYGRTTPSPLPKYVVLYSPYYIYKLWGQTFGTAVITYNPALDSQWYNRLGFKLSTLDLQTNTLMTTPRGTPQALVSHIHVISTCLLFLLKHLFVECIFKGWDYKSTSEPMGVIISAEVQFHHLNWKWLKVVKNVVHWIRL